MLRLCSVLVLLVLPTLTWADLRGVVRVIDADTVDVGKIRVRLHAIDAPEQDQLCQTDQGADFACGAWATARVVEAFEGRRATCDHVDRDRYGRVVARCSMQGVDMGRHIVREGWAFAARAYGLDYDLDEKVAYVAGRGLHAFQLQSPTQFLQARAKGLVPPHPSCAIKGNISDNGRVFHMPGQRFYQQTEIHEASGERWFCSEAAALRAGWRAASY
ncbi:thermonuclease family protein [uncultured Tateyamaria sp.]|uniref:thermonuclease family protein n=1 Tax=uncultured Tateyamaria sp. TaxID=455651 RepID=UPI002602FD26|nr:thermonuclease family protein [uncultured Tateyamaria sp.]